MSWFDSFSDLLTGDNGQKSILPTLVDTGAKVAGNMMSIDANKKANSQQTAALQAQQRELQAERDQASTGTTALQQQVQRGQTLNPQQEQALTDARLQTQTALNASGLGGSGRAVVAGVNKVDNDMRANFMGQNQNNADKAAEGLSSQYFNTGKNLGQNLVDQGNNNGRATLANTSLAGSALGDIAGAISNYAKDQNTNQYSLAGKKNNQTQDSSPTFSSGGGYSWGQSDSSEGQ